MSVPRYPEYKDSGVEWLGEVPAGWEVKRLRFLAQLNPSRTETANLAPTTEVSFLPMDAVGDDGTLDLERTRQLQDVETGYTYFREEDVTFAKITPCFENGKGAVMRGLTGGLGFGTTELIVARPRPDQTTSDYLHWVFSSPPFRKLGEAAMYGAGGQKRVPDAFVRDFALAMPPLPEQATITAFLDRETGKIDALVAEQERLIELLKEKRQAVISHAVTKGLDPNAPMKDSCIAWLGKVPAHWEVSRVKHLCLHVVDCLHTTPTYDGDVEYPAIRTADVDRGVLLLDQARLVSLEIYEERIQRLRPVAGDILYSREGERFGMAALVPEGVDLCLGQRMMMFRVNDRVSPGFTMWLLNSDAVYKQVLEKVGGSTSPHVNISDIINFHVTLPPPDEQSKIAEHIATTTASVDALIAESQLAIDLLKERRAALISAAVTGKIDVRPRSAEIIPFPSRVRRNLAAAEAVRRCHGERTFGRIKAQKVFYLLETHLGLEEFEGRYQRHIKGPFDGQMMTSIAHDLEAAGWFREVPEDNRYYYRPLDRSREVSDLFNKAWEKRTEEIVNLIELLRPLDTDTAEVIATLYAAWNDFLLRGATVDDTKLISEVRTNWHESKQSIPEQAWIEGLRWMRQHHLIPRGSGRPTTHQPSLDL